MELKITTIALIILLYSTQIINAQTITGKITDNEQNPIEGATVVLLAIDSTYLGASISDTNGIFTLGKQPKEYRLIIEHLSYLTKQIVGKDANVGIIKMDSKNLVLDDVVIKAKQPFVKVGNGSLEYNLSTLNGSGIANNTYEALVKIPGVQEIKGKLTLTGAGDLTVILNGKPTTMDAAQLETLLRNTPINRVAKVEVMYSAPPQYHVRGAVINVVLKRSNDYSFQGEVNANYTNRYFSSGGVNGNFRLSTPKIAFDVMYSANDVKNMEYMNIYSKHTLKEEVYEINQNNQISSNYWDHNLRAALEYNFNNNSNITLSYTGNFNPDQHNKSQTTGDYQTSRTDKYIDTRMHNVQLQYHTAFGLDIGGDYTLYSSGNQQNLNTNYQDGSRSSLNLLAEQKIDRYNIYADQNHKLSKNWNLGYGVSYKFAHDRDSQTYDNVEGDIHTQNTNSNLKEHTANFYASVGKNYESGTSFSISATGEYYSIGNSQKWAIYPQATFNYQKTPAHIFQLSLSTDKTYPSYWNMQSSVSYVDGYTELWGTPGLSAMTTYNLNGSYILKQKYIFSMFFMHTTDYFAQAAYQSTDRLALIYKYLNWDYMQLWGVNVALPFKIGNWLDSRLTLEGMQMQQRCDDFFDISFNRKRWFFSASLDNTFKINQNLSFELNGNVQTPTIQGTLNVESSFNLTAGVKWSLAKDKMTLSARCSDIFGAGVPNINIRYKGQYLNMNNNFYSRSFTVNLNYRFGGYKSSERKKIDTSRFGH